MPDDLTKRAPQDRKRIAIGEDHEVLYWTSKFHVTREALTDAVNSVGNSAQAVADYLGKRI